MMGCTWSVVLRHKSFLQLDNPNVWDTLDSVILRVGRIRQIKDDGRVRPSTTPRAAEDLLEVDSSVEAKRTVRQDVNPVTLIVARSVEDRDLTKILA